MKTKNTFAFINDILIVTKGKIKQYWDKVDELLKTLEEAGIKLEEEKCNSRRKKQNG